MAKRRTPVRARRAIGVSFFPKLFAEHGWSRSSGYRYVRQYLGMSIAEAKVQLLAEELATGTPLLEAFKRLGISRATGYRLCKKVAKKR